MMKKVQIDPSTQRRPSSRKQNRSAKIKEQLTQQVEVEVIPVKTDVEGYERPKPRVCAYCRVSTNMNVPGAIFADEGVIIFALEQAYAPAKGGWTIKRQRDEEAAAAAAAAAAEESDE